MLLQVLDYNVPKGDYTQTLHTYQFYKCHTPLISLIHNNKLHLISPIYFYLLSQTTRDACNYCYAK